MMNRSDQCITRRFAYKVRDLRKALGWSQEVLAHKSRLNRSFVGQIERAETQVSIITLEKLAIAFKIPLSDLLEDLMQNNNSENSDPG
jgi:XRE family transcriptional regulator, regulator of sulfur utilization